MEIIAKLILEKALATINYGDVGSSDEAGPHPCHPRAFSENQGTLSSNGRNMGKGRWDKHIGRAKITDEKIPKGPITLQNIGKAKIADEKIQKGPIVLHH